MENENITEKENVDVNQSGAGEAAQLDVSAPIAGGIVSQMAIQEDVAQVSGGGEELAGATSPSAEGNEASTQGGVDSKAASGAEQEK